MIILESRSGGQGWSSDGEVRKEQGIEMCVWGDSMPNASLAQLSLAQPNGVKGHSEASFQLFKHMNAQKQSVCSEMQGLSARGRFRVCERRDYNKNKYIYKYSYLELLSDQRAVYLLPPCGLVGEYRENGMVPEALRLQHAKLQCGNIFF